MNTVRSSHKNFKMGPRRTHPLKIISAMLLSMITLLLIIYVGGAVYFTDRFMPNTTVGGLSLSFKTSSEAEDAIKSMLEKYTLTLSGEDLEIALTSTEMGLISNVSEAVSAMLDEMDPWLWPFQIAQSFDVSDKLITGTAGTSLYDAISEAVETYNSTATAPINASIAYDWDLGELTLIEETAGNTFNLDAVVELAEEAVESFTSSVTLTSAQFETPSITVSDSRLLAAIREGNALSSTQITLTMNDCTLTQLSSETILSWITLDEDYNVSLDEDAIASWASSIDEEYSTVGGTRTYTRDDGKEITVTGGIYGWNIDEESLATLVQATVLLGGTYTLEVPVITSGDDYIGAGLQDWSANYLDIDLTEQYARLYDENGDIIWEADIISGSTLTNDETPTGVYWMNQTSSPSTLIGYDSDGEIDYETEVEYWMPFIGNSIGLHDASWQTSGFGGTLYMSGYGSHGCINLSTEDAAALFELIGGGDVVVCHY